MRRPKYEEESEDEEEYFSQLAASKYNNDDEEDEGDDMGSISFGALNKAQNSLLKEKRMKRQEEDNSQDSDSDGPPEEFGSNNRDTTTKRRSKHAPSEQSATKPVSWIRSIPGLGNKKSNTLYQDIRFDPAYGKADLTVARKNYEFLNEYRANELTEMRERLKKTRDPGEKAELEREIQSMRSRLDTLKQRDFDAQVLAKHKKSQREKGYYLKRSEKRELILTEKFKTMKKKDIQKRVERKRKKNAAKERKLMPEARRS
ncbi:rRNA biogenesis protein Rrp36p [Trichomonascus vanleenenianus]|uniref:rRNA-processing protein RRP36 n=1 Tax=Trichomonascus vanleenenianus TaxID=2268995 RepID=UPI003ECB5161